MINIQHLPVLAVMGCFLGAFLIEIFGSKNKIVRNIITMIFVLFACCSVALLIKPILLDGRILTYWLGSWEPVQGYAIGIGYEIDAFGEFFAILVAFTMLMSSIYSFRYMERDSHLGHYYTLFLMLSGSILGMVFTGDLFNMFVMIEIMTFAAVALTAFRNDSDGALEAAFKYLVIGSIGSSFTLLGVAVLYRTCHTLNMAQVASMLAKDGAFTPPVVFAFGLLFTGLALKSYIVPFHTPAADAYTTAPASISMAFSSMVNKAGVYALLRLLYVIFKAMDINAILILTVVFGALTMFVGVTMALAQHDFKRLLAFHSISQIGYVITAAGLGTALGLNGALYHAMNHTLFKGLLFLCAGAVFYAAGTTSLDRLGGLSKKMPKTTICFLIGAFSISGLPPFNGFASKWQIYQATFAKAQESGNVFYVFVTVVAVIVSVMTLASFIKVTQSVFFGQVPENCRNVKEVPLSMRIPMWIMGALCIACGIGSDFLNSFVLGPAVSAAYNVTGYINSAMGSGYAESAGVVNNTVHGATFVFWSPVCWLILFITILLAIFFVGITGTGERRAVTYDGEIADGKKATFFGGERYSHSHVTGSDLFWGFKRNMTGYFDFMESKHSGVVNDYARYVVVAAALVLVFMFIFLLLV